MIDKYDLISNSLKQLNQFTITFTSNNNTMLNVCMIRCTANYYFLLLSLSCVFLVSYFSTFMSCFFSPFETVLPTYWHS